MLPLDHRDALVLEPLAGMPEVVRVVHDRQEAEVAGQVVHEGLDLGDRHLLAPGGFRDSPEGVKLRPRSRLHNATAASKIDLPQPLGIKPTSRGAAKNLLHDLPLEVFQPVAKHPEKRGEALCLASRHATAAPARPQAAQRRVFAQRPLQGHRSGNFPSRYKRAKIATASA